MNIRDQPNVGVFCVIKNYNLKVTDVNYLHVLLLWLVGLDNILSSHFIVCVLSESLCKIVVHSDCMRLICDICCSWWMHNTKRVYSLKHHRIYFSHFLVVTQETDCVVYDKYDHAKNILIPQSQVFNNQIQ